MKIKTNRNDGNEITLNQLNNTSVKMGDTKFKEDLKILNSVKVLIEEVEKDEVINLQTDKATDKKEVELNEAPYVFVAHNFVSNKKDKNLELTNESISNKTVKVTTKTSQEVVLTAPHATTEEFASVKGILFEKPQIQELQKTIKTLNNLPKTDDLSEKVIVKTSGMAQKNLVVQEVFENQINEKIIKNEDLSFQSKQTLAVDTVPLGEEVLITQNITNKKYVLKSELSPDIQGVKAVMQEFAGELKPEIRAVSQEFVNSDVLQNVLKPEVLNGVKVVANQTQAILKPEIQPQIQVANQPQIRVANPQQQMQIENQPQAILKPEIQPQIQVENQPQTILKPEIQPQIQVANQPQIRVANPQTQVENQPQTILKPEIQPQLQVENQAQIVQKPEIQQQPQVEGQEQTAKKPEIQPHIQVENQPQILSKPKIQSQIQVTNQSQIRVANPQAQVKDQAQIVQKPEAQLQMQVESQVQVKLGIQPQTQLKPQMQRQDRVNTVFNKQETPQIEQKTVDGVKTNSELLANLLKEPVDFVKKVPTMEEVIPQQLRSVIKKDVFSQNEKFELKNVSNKETSAIDELKKFMSETFSQETIEELKTQNPAIKGNNVLLNDEIKSYYNLNNAKATMMDDIQSIITERVSALAEVSKALSSTREVSEIQRELNSIETKPAKSQKMPEVKILKVTEKDATFFASLIKNSEVNEQVSGETTKALMENVKQAAESARTATVSKTLADLIDESSKTNKPFRIDFDKGISVIIKVDKDGKISAEFLPGDKAVEQYLRNSIPLLRQKFDEEQIDYKELNYRQSNKQNKERKNKENKNE